MKVIIPAAGVGSRLRPFTNTMPKSLLQVADKPMLGHILDRIVEVGVKEVTFIIGHFGDMIKDYVNKNYPSLQANFVEQNDPLGLGHAVLLAAPYHSDSEPTLIILGDTILDTDLSLLKDAQNDMIGVCEVEDARRFGVVELDGDRILSMVEKPEKPLSNLAIVGIYYIRQPSILFKALDAHMHDVHRAPGEIHLTDGLRCMMKEGGSIHAFRVNGWYDCGKTETLLATNEVLLRQRFSGGVTEIQARYPDSRISPPVYIDPTAVLKDAVIGPNVAVGARVTISHATVSNSIINMGAEIQNVVLADSIIGNEVQICGKGKLRLCVGDQSKIFLD